MQNSRAAPSKLSTIEQTTNRLLYLILATQVLLVAVTLAAYLAWSSERAGQLHYLCLDFLARSSPDFYRMNCSPTVDDTSDLGMFAVFFLLYNNMGALFPAWMPALVHTSRCMSHILPHLPNTPTTVPISLYVTVEMVNYVQAFFIDQDLEVRGRACVCAVSVLIAPLGESGSPCALTPPVCTASNADVRRPDRDARHGAHQ